MKRHLGNLLVWCVLGIGGLCLGFYSLYRAFLDEEWVVGILGGIFVIAGMWFVAKSHNNWPSANHDKFG